MSVFGPVIDQGIELLRTLRFPNQCDQAEPRIKPQKLAR